MGTSKQNTHTPGKQMSFDLLCSVSAETTSIYTDPVTPAPVVQAELQSSSQLQSSSRAPDTIAYTSNITRYLRHGCRESRAVCSVTERRNVEQAVSVPFWLLSDGPKLHPRTHSQSTFARRSARLPPASSTRHRHGGAIDRTQTTQ